MSPARAAGMLGRLEDDGVTLTLRAGTRHELRLHRDELGGHVSGQRLRYA